MSDGPYMRTHGPNICIECLFLFLADSTTVMRASSENGIYIVFQTGDTSRNPENYGFKISYRAVGAPGTSVTDFPR